LANQIPVIREKMNTELVVRAECVQNQSVRVRTTATEKKDIAITAIADNTKNQIAFKIPMIKPL